MIEGPTDIERIYLAVHLGFQLLDGTPEDAESRRLEHAWNELIKREVMGNPKALLIDLAAISLETAGNLNTIHSNPLKPSPSQKIRQRINDWSIWISNPSLEAQPNPEWARHYQIVWLRPDPAGRERFLEHPRGFIPQLIRDAGLRYIANGVKLSGFGAFGNLCVTDYLSAVARQADIPPQHTQVLSKLCYDLPPDRTYQNSKFALQQEFPNITG